VLAIHPYQLIYGPEVLIREGEDAVQVLSDTGFVVAFRDDRDSAAKEVA